MCGVTARRGSCFRRRRFAVLRWGLSRRSAVADESQQGVEYTVCTRSGGFCGCGGHWSSHSYLLVNENNIRVLVRELVNYLLVADAEFKQDLTAKICIVVQKFAPTKQWHVDTIIKVRHGASVCNGCATVVNPHVPTPIVQTSRWHFDAFSGVRVHCTPNASVRFAQTPSRCALLFAFGRLCRS